MLDKIAVVVHETEAGQASVKLYADAEKAMNGFNNLHGRVQDPPSRVTFISLDFKDNKSVVLSKTLPVQDTPKDEQPDGIVLGQGPIWLDKEAEDGGKDVG